MSAVASRRASCHSCPLTFASHSSRRAYSCIRCVAAAATRLAADWFASTASASRAAFSAREKRPAYRFASASRNAACARSLRIRARYAATRCGIRHTLRTIRISAYSTMNATMIASTKKFSDTSMRYGG